MNQKQRSLFLNIDSKIVAALALAAIMSIGAIVIALPQQVKADNQNGNNGVLAVTATYNANGGNGGDANGGGNNVNVRHHHH